MNQTNQKGFSLVELMVVVAVTGMLAAIGVSQYSKFKQRTLESEAKTALSSLFTAERSFHSEYNFYHTSLRAIGFGLEGKIFHNIGFGNPTNLTPTDYGFVATVDDTVINSSTQCVGANATGTDTSCRAVTTLPVLPIMSTSFESVYIAAAAIDPTAYAAVGEIPVQDDLSTLEMVAQTVIQPTPAHATLPPNETLCEIAYNNPILANDMFKKCVEAEIISRPPTYPTNIQLWVITSKKNFKGLFR